MTSAPSARSATDPSERILADLVEDFLARVHAGEHIDASTFVAEHPEQAEALRELLPALEMMAAVSRSQADQVQRASFRSPARDAELGTLGDYRILREVGRGGMGVVYEAQQISLNRRVALKVLPFAAALDPRQLQRFHNEAQAAAGLHHTNIVPVFTVGCDRGVHYYAMQFIDGRALAEVIEALRRLKQPEDLTAESLIEPTRKSVDGQNGPLDCTPLSSGSSIASQQFFETVARLGIQAAAALDYAHSLGVIHRDIKPANLLIDGRGDIWVTDFGLARIHAETGLTMSGAIVGTLRYMSPEQALGRSGAIDHRSDIYSLGATLYELLTLRPVFPGSERQELLHQITLEEPIRLRRHNQAVPRELETIVLKAMAKEAADRYATAQELAADLERFLQHKPIEAKRPSFLGRAAKWAHRHTGVVASGIVILILATSALLTSTLLIAREKERTLAALKAEAEERRRAQGNLKLGFQVLDEMYVDEADRRLPRAGPLRPEDREFLRRALTFYEQFASQDSTDVGVRAKVAKAHLRVADILLKLGQNIPALDNYGKAIAAFERLSHAFPGDVTYKEDWAKSLNNQGYALLELERWKQADQAFRRALAIKEELVRDHPANSSYRVLLERAYSNLGGELRRAGKLREAEAVFRRTIGLLEISPTALPNDRSRRFSLARCEGNLGALLDESGRAGEAEGFFRRAVKLLQQLCREAPGVVEYRQELVVCLNNFAFLLAKTNRITEAETSIREGLTVSEGLAREFPNLPKYRGILADSHYLLGNVLLADPRRVPEGQKNLRVAMRLFEALVADFPDVPDHRDRLEDAYLEVLRPLYAPGRYGELRDLYREALKNLPKSLRLRSFFTRLLAACPDHRYRDPEQAILMAKEATQRAPGEADHWTDLGAAYCAAGRWDDAIEALDRSTRSRNGGDGLSAYLLATAHSQRGENTEAGRWFDRGLLWQEKNAMSLSGPDAELLRGLRDEAAAILGRSEAELPEDLFASP